jgi:small basic protein
MSYVTSMVRLLRLDFSQVKQIPMTHIQYICIAHVAILGLIYGCTAAFLAHGMLFEQAVDTTSFSFSKIIIAGIPVAFLMHAGTSLFIWVFLKAMGGNANFMTAYFFIGVAAISLWPLAPFIALLQTQAAGPAVPVAAVFPAVYALAVNAKMLQHVFALSFTKMVIALSAAIVYMGCFLYLWV